MKKVFVIAVVLGLIAILGLGIATYSFFNVDINAKQIKIMVDQAKKRLPATLDDSENRLLLLSQVASDMAAIIKSSDTPNPTEETIKIWSESHAFERSNLSGEELKALKNAALLLSPVVIQWTEAGKKAGGIYPFDPKNALEGAGQVQTQALLESANAMLVAADLAHFQKKYDVVQGIVHANLAAGGDLLASHLSLPQATGAKIVLTTLQWYYRALSQDTDYSLSSAFSTIKSDLDRLKSMESPVIAMVENEILFFHHSIAYVLDGKKDELRKKLPRFFLKIFLDRDYKIGMDRYAKLLESIKSAKDPQALEKKFETQLKITTPSMTPVTQAMDTKLALRVIPLMHSEAVIRIYDLVAALVHHRQEKGTYPDALDALATELQGAPTDPLAPSNPPNYNKVGNFYQLTSHLKGKYVYVDTPLSLQEPLPLLDLFSPAELILKTADTTQDLVFSQWDMENFMAALASESTLVESVIFDPFLQDTHQYGFKVGTITTSGPAAKLGLVMGDIVFAVDQAGPALFNEAILMDLLKTKGSFTLLVLRDNKTILMRVSMEGVTTPWITSTVPVAQPEAAPVTELPTVQPAAPMEPSVTPTLPVQPTAPVQSIPVLTTTPSLPAGPVLNSLEPAAQPTSSPLPVSTPTETKPVAPALTAPEAPGPL